MSVINMFLFYIFSLRLAIPPYTHTIYFERVSFQSYITRKALRLGGEQLAMYCGEDLGDLIVITLNKYI